MTEKVKKIVYGQFFTKEKLWLKPQVLDFIIDSQCSTAFDPFAGGGHLLDSAKNIGFTSIVGMDIDKNLGWEYNDSLISIPHIDDATIIITNPPYLSNYSASRKKIMKNVKHYFNSTKYDDLYLLSLDNMLKSQKYVVAIIPETFINSKYENKNYLHSITILEESPFEDTDTPVVVACFDGVYKDLADIKIYKNEKYVNNLKNIEQMRLKPSNKISLKFNSKEGWLAVRCVDTTSHLDMLRYSLKENMNYDWENCIKGTSRLLTLIDIDIPENQRETFISICNDTLNKLRNDTGDIILSPFKGNMKNGRRRRRLDYKTCRAIIENTYYKMFANKGEISCEQLSLL